MLLSSQNFAHHAAIPSEFAYARIAEPMTLSSNRNPHLAWAEVPEGTQSFALFCVDIDVPIDFTRFNQAGQVIAADVPRQDFVHWVMVDMPGDLRELAAGSCADGTPKGGKANPPGPLGARQGSNDYTGFMKDGDYCGYDGPCPPWNDLRVHHYHFRLYALSVARLSVPERFGLVDAQAAMRGCILAQAELVGTYSLNAGLLAAGT